jgi:death-on-curing protein
MKEPLWLSRPVVDSIHLDQLREHGGFPGIRDENALESALSRARNKWEYGEGRDLAELAAAYAFGISSSHPYRDGNKRITFLAMVTFLGLNEKEFDATEEDVVVTMLALASGQLSEKRLAKWIRERISRASSADR